MTVKLMKNFGDSSELGPNSQIYLKVQAVVRAQAVGLRVPSSGQRQVTKHRHDEPGTKESLEKSMNVGRIDIESEATERKGMVSSLVRLNRTEVIELVKVEDEGYPSWR
jgi:hypothetical protein